MTAFPPCVLAKGWICSARQLWNDGISCSCFGKFNGRGTFSFFARANPQDVALLLYFKQCKCRKSSWVTNIPRIFDTSSLSNLLRLASHICFSSGPASTLMTCRPNFRRLSLSVKIHLSFRNSAAAIFSFLLPKRAS